MRIAIAAALISLSIVGLSAAGPAVALIRKPIDIPAESLDAALRSLASVEDIHVMFVSEDVAKLRTGGLSGSFTTDEALSRLLLGTGLTYRYLDTNTVSITPVAQNSPPPSANETGKEGAGGPSDRFRER